MTMPAAGSIREFAALRAAQTVALSAAVMLSLFSHRSDYGGHFLAGAGGTLLLLAVLLAIPGRSIGYDAVAAVLVAIAIGWVTESTIFKLAVFDAVDFANQSLGAALAATCVLGCKRSMSASAGCGLIGIVALIAGFWFAFA